MTGPVAGSGSVAGAGPVAGSGPAALLILDGWGLAPAGGGNAVALANTPHFDALWQRWPHTELVASGEAVGLAAGQMGNSNVGHLNLGAGRVVAQDLSRINRAVEAGELATNPALRRLLDAVATTPAARLHVWGLLSDGGVHSHMQHLLALLACAAERGVPVAVHAVLDGRDTPPNAGRAFLAELERFIAERGRGLMRLSSVMGRFFAMDRDKRWERTEAAYRAMVDGHGARTAGSGAEAVAQAYAAGETDEFVRPTVVLGSTGPAGTPGAAAVDAAGSGRLSATGPVCIRPGDVVLCFNFRADRARQLSAALALPHFTGFAREPLSLGAYGGFTLYEEALAPYMEVLFPREPVAQVLGEVVSQAGFPQLRIAETEKYAHVTYFFNGGEETPFEGEDRILVPSPKVATYDLAPEMSAAEVADRAVAAIRGHQPPYRLIVLNFANPDMVGHTGSTPAAIRAVEAADAGLGRVVAALTEAGGAALVLADHGNAEQMVDPVGGGPWTAHTTNLVPCILVAPGREGTRLRGGGGLADVAPTLLQLLDLAQPAVMTGRSLIASDIS